MMRDEALADRLNRNPDRLPVTPEDVAFIRNRLRHTLAPFAYAVLERFPPEQRSITPWRKSIAPWGDEAIMSGGLTRLCNVIMYEGEEHGSFGFNDLAAMTDAEILRLPNCGRRTLWLIRAIHDVMRFQT